MPLTPGIHHLTPTVPVHVFDAPKPGPTALIQAGIHGDEIAGVHALCELLEEEIRPDCGRLIVIPVMNAPAYRVQQRSSKGGLDLNRCFPGDSGASARELRLARKFMDLVEDERPGLMATLHESKKRYDPLLPLPSFGQTLVYGVEPMPAILGRTLDRLNARFTGVNEHWDPHYFPVATSSTEVIVEAIGCVGICVETWMGFALEHRIAMHRAVVEILLAEFGVRALKNK